VSALQTGMITSWPAEAFADLLGVEPPTNNGGTALPLLWHWFYVLDHAPQADLGEDGHPAPSPLAVPSPPRAGMRRMFAGGRAENIAPLQIGRSATRRSSVLRAVTKRGRSGELTFVTVLHEIWQSRRRVIREEQDIVYRDATREPSVVAPSEGAQAQVVPDGDAWMLDPSPSFLFRFSALTYNAHRIHYDREYARDIEGYPGLLVHGPLQALAMAELARRNGFPGRHIEYRLVAPLFDLQGMSVSADSRANGILTEVRDATGRVTASALIS